MKHQWPPEVTRAMHQFSDAAPVAPSLTSVNEHRPSPPSRRPRRALVEPEQHLVPVKEIYVSLDSPTSETRNRRRLAMAAAALIALIAVIGVAAIAINRMNSEEYEAPAPAAATTVAPTTVAPRRETGVFEGGGKRVTYTVPDGWENIGGRPPYGVTKGDPVIGVVFVDAGDNFYTHYCRSARRISAPVGPTIDDLVSAWANLPGVDATAARDVTIDGFDGKQIEFTVPTYTEEDCNGMFSRCSALSREPDRPTRCENELRNRANQHLKIWILDVDGGRYMIVAGSSPDSSQQDRAALDEIVASIQIG